MTNKFGPKLKNVRLSNLPIENIEENVLYVLFRLFFQYVRDISQVTVPVSLKKLLF